MKHIKINNKQFPVKFSFQALDELCELRNCSLAELDELSDVNKIKPRDVLFMAYVGLKEGARREGKAFSLSLDEVDDLLSQDMPAIGRIMAVYAHQNTPPEGGNPTPPAKTPGKAKKKAAPKS